MIQYVSNNFAAPHWIEAFSRWRYSGNNWHCRISLFFKCVISRALHDTRRHFRGPQSNKNDTKPNKKQTGMHKRIAFYPKRGSGLRGFLFHCPVFLRCTAIYDEKCGKQVYLNFFGFLHYQQKVCLTSEKMRNHNQQRISKKQDGCHWEKRFKRSNI